MTTTKRHLIDEQTSPLHRIMWVTNPEEPGRRTFENNICAFHIGKGYFLSVAHNLRTSSGIFRAISEETFQKELLYKLDGSQKLFFDQHYFADGYTRKLYLNNADQATISNIAAILKQKRFDTRWATLAEKKISIPHVVVQLRQSTFYGKDDAAAHFRPHQLFYEKDINRHSYLLEVELVEAFYAEDIALYKTVNVPEEILQMLPHVDVNTDLVEDDPGSLHCLQSSPNIEAGRMLNDAKLEGLLDHVSMVNDDMSGNYLLEGYRYLVKGYFRFGSSGAPYVVYDPLRAKYVVNAIQSEACGQQLTIRNERDGNFQYVNAIASPLYLIKEKLRELKLGDGSGFEHVF